MTSQATLATKSYIYYNPERIDFTVSEEELERLCSGDRSLWRDFCLVSTSLGVPCVINALAEIQRQTQFVVTPSVFLNSLVGTVAVFLAVCFGIQWWRTRNTIDALIKRVKCKPRLEIQPTVSQVGALVAEGNDQALSE